MSKRIYFIRHAKSSWKDHLMTDHDRLLDERGLQDAPFMAKLLKEDGFNIDKIVSSTANRASTTAGYFEKAFGLEALLEKQLYHGEPDDYLEVINLQEETVSALALFGHNPGITYLANILKPNITDNIPTCGIIICTVKDNVDWNNVDWKHIRLDRILTPKNTSA